MGFDESAWQSRGYPDRVDVNWFVWRLYPLLGEPASIDEIGRRVEDGSIFEWLHERYGLSRPQQEARFVDYLRRAYDITDYGIAHSGLTCLHAHIVEALQQSASEDAWHS